MKDCYLDYEYGIEINLLESIDISSAWCPNSGIIMSKDGSIKIANCIEEVTNKVEAFAKTKVLDKIIDKVD